MGLTTVTTGLKSSQNLSENGIEIEMPFGILSSLRQPTGIVFTTDMDGNTSGYRYKISFESSHLRPVRNWTITIDSWQFERGSANSTTTDIMSMCVKNRPSIDINDGANLVSDIRVMGQSLTIDNKTTLNMIMALSLIINKIDTQQMPNIAKIVETYKLN